MLDEIEGIVRMSGKKVKEAHGFTVDNKGTRENLVTSMDLENERFLKGELTGLIPGSAFVGEEGDEGKIASEGYTWVVDPIDGTTNFSRGIPMVGISVALFRDGVPFMGVVYNPFTDTLWKAEAGKGAWKDGRRIHVSDKRFEDGIMCTAWCTYRKEFAPSCFRICEKVHPLCNDIRRIGTAACELSMLGEGAVDLYFEVRLSPWDYSAALLIVKEAGGFYTSIEGDVYYDGTCPVIAANSEENLSKLADIVREEFGGRRPY